MDDRPVTNSLDQILSSPQQGIGWTGQPLPFLNVGNFPAGGFVHIGADVPLVVAQYYATHFGGTVINSAWIGMYVDANNYSFIVSGFAADLAAPFYGYGTVVAGVAYTYYRDYFSSGSVIRKWGDIDAFSEGFTNYNAAYVWDTSNVNAGNINLNGVAMSWGLRQGSRGTSTTGLTTSGTTEKDLPFAQLPGVICYANRINVFEFSFHASQSISTDKYQWRLRRDTAVTGTLLATGSFNVSLSAQTERLYMRAAVRATNPLETVSYFMSVTQVSGTGTCTVFPRVAGSADDSSISTVTDAGPFGVAASVWTDR